MTIRLASPDDAPAVQAIYAPYVTDTVITFEYDVPTATEFAQRIRTIQEQQQLPYLVAEMDGMNQERRIIGYAYASKHRDRIAYQWSVDVSVYLHPDGHGKGIAKNLYDVLFDYLRRQGYVNAYAGITLPNPKSEGFHRKIGFTLVGVYKQVGYKFGAWHDVGWSAMALGPHSENPTPPRPISDIV